MIGVIQNTSEIHIQNSNESAVVLVDKYNNANIIPKTYYCIVESGIVLSATSGTVPALSLAGFATGSVVVLVNSGHLLGMAGKGANGGGGVSAIWSSDCTDAYSCATTSNGPYLAGGNGGYAVLSDANLGALAINNTNGYIFGGGGGGGGGGVIGTGTSIATGGGGGAGAGVPNSGGTNGSYSDTACALSPSKYLGGNGQATQGTAPNYTAGNGGSNNNFGSGSYTSGAGGVGGDWGADGTPGSDPNQSCSYTNMAARSIGSNGGLAGKAIELGGGVTPTWQGGNNTSQVKGSVS